MLIEQDIVDVEVCHRIKGLGIHHYFLGDDVPLEAVALSPSVAEIYQRADNEDMQAFIADLQSNQAGAGSDRAAETF